MKRFWVTSLTYLLILDWDFAYPRSARLLDKLRKLWKLGDKKLAKRVTL